MNTVDPTVTGLNILLVSLAVLVVFYNVFSGWRNGVVRQICRIIAIAAAYVFGALLGPMIAPLLTFVHLPPAGVNGVASCGVGLVVYVVLKIITNILFRKTREQESGVVRFFYGLGGAVIGLIFSAVFLIFFLVAIRGLGTIGEAQMSVSAQRGEKLPPRSATFVPQLVQAKKTLENGPVGPLIKAIDPTPTTVYTFLDKLGRVTSDPAAMQRFVEYPGSRQLLDQPAFQELAQDPIIQKMIQNREFNALVTNKKVIQAFKDEKIRSELQKFELGKALDYSLHNASQAPTPQPTPQPVEQY